MAVSSSPPNLTYLLNIGPTLTQTVKSLGSNYKFRTVYHFFSQSSTEPDLPTQNTYKTFTHVSHASHQINTFGSQVQIQIAGCQPPYHRLDHFIPSQKPKPRHPPHKQAPITRYFHRYHEHILPLTNSTQINANTRER